MRKKDGEKEEVWLFLFLMFEKRREGEWLREPPSIMYTPTTSIKHVSRKINMGTDDVPTFSFLCNTAYTPTNTHTHTHQQDSLWGVRSHALGSTISAPYSLIMSNDCHDCYNINSEWGKNMDCCLQVPILCHLMTVWKGQKRVFRTDLSEFTMEPTLWIWDHLLFCFHLFMLIIPMKTTKTKMYFF